MSLETGMCVHAAVFMGKYLLHCYLLVKNPEHVNGHLGIIDLEKGGNGEDNP